MGLPGAGKTTLADELAPLLNAKRLNADEVRKNFLAFLIGPKKKKILQSMWPCFQMLC